MLMELLKTVDYEVFYPTLIKYIYNLFLNKLIYNLTIMLCILYASILYFIVKKEKKDKYIFGPTKYSIFTFFNVNKLVP